MASTSTRSTPSARSSSSKPPCSAARRSSCRPVGRGEIAPARRRTVRRSGRPGRPRGDGRPSAAATGCAAPPTSRPAGSDSDARHAVAPLLGDRSQQLVDPQRHLLHRHTELGGPDRRGQHPQQQGGVDLVEHLGRGGLDERLGAAVDHVEDPEVLQQPQSVDEGHAFGAARRVEGADDVVGRGAGGDPVGEQPDRGDRHREQLGGQDAEQYVTSAVERGAAGAQPAGRPAGVCRRPDLDQPRVAEPGLDGERPSAVVVEPLADRVVPPPHQVELLWKHPLMDQRGGQQQSDAARDLLALGDHQLVGELTHVRPPSTRRAALRSAADTSIW